MKIGLVAASAVMFASMASVAPAQQAAPRVYTPPESENSAPNIDLWLDQVNYRSGDIIRPHFVTDRGAFVTVIRVTSDGYLSVLYPRRPKDQARYFEGQLVDDRVPPYILTDNRFRVGESRGLGFVFAIASFEKFDYSYFSSGGDWSVARLTNDGRYGDPFEIARRFADRTLGDTGDYSLDYVSYSVEGEGVRSRYSTRYAYSTYDDFYDSCYSAFGLRYSSYCYNAYPGYYGPIIVVQPGKPTPGPVNGRNLAGKRIKPVTGDPLVGGAPTGPQVITEGRVPTVNPAEAAAEASQRARMLRNAAPKDRAPSQVEIPVYRGVPQSAPPQRAEPVQRVEPMERPQMERPVIRAEPRVEQPRMEQPRVEQQRYEPAPAPRVEVRNDPPPQPRQVSAPAPAPAPASAPVQQSAPRATATPAEKDHQN